MPKQRLTIKDWSAGSNNRKDPRDLQENECSWIQGMSIDALGKISGGLYASLADSDGDTSSSPLTEYIVSRTINILNTGGYGLFYFESDHSRDSEQSLSVSRGNTYAADTVKFVQTSSSTDVSADEPALTP